jgi:hypothetical protein
MSTVWTVDSVLTPSALRLCSMQVAEATATSEMRIHPHTPHSAENKSRVRNVGDARRSRM